MQAGFRDYSTLPDKLLPEIGTLPPYIQDVSVGGVAGGLQAVGVLAAEECVQRQVAGITLCRMRSRLPTDY